MHETLMSPEALADRTRRAVETATHVGRELGLEVGEPRVLHDAFSVIVHLAPSPVVARLPVVLPPGLDEETQAARQARELDVAGWLDAEGHPVVRPSPAVPRRPVSRDGFSITLWEHVEIDAARQPDFVADTRFAAELHAALASYPGELPFLSPVAHTVPSCLAALDQRPDLVSAADLDRARREWAVLAPVLASREAFVSRFPNARVQAIHGDAPAYNMIHTTAGPRFADLEDVTLGPIEWDLAAFGPEAAAVYDVAADRVGIPAHDPRILAVMDAARMLQTVACLALVPALPMLAEALAPSIAAWRTMPLAGGLGD